MSQAPLKTALTMEIIDGPEMTGCQYYAYHLARSLRDRPEVELTLIGSDRTPPELLPSGIPRTVHAPKRFMGTAFFDSLIRPPRGLGRFDLIHCPTVIAPFYFNPGAKVVMTVHDLVPLVLPEFSPWRRRIYFRHVVGRRLKRADGIIAVSRTTRDDLLEKYRLPRKKIAIIAEGVDPGFRPGEGLKEDFILSVATLEPRKNLKGLMAGFALLKKATGLKTRLLLAGRTGWGREELFRVPQEFGRDIEFLGYVSRPELIGLFQRARAFAYPSYYEGFGLPVLEAMACGCPVLTTDRASLPEVGGGACLYADPDSPQEIGEGLGRILTDPALARELAQKGLARAREFSWEECARRTAEFYGRVAER